MLDKERLLNDLKIMKEEDEKKKREAETWAEIHSLEGSIINLETLIESIESGTYDK